MKVSAFKSWLTERYPKPTVAASYFSYAKRVEDAYGDLDLLYDQGGFEGILIDLAFSSSDAAAGKADTSKLGLTGNPYNQLSNFRTGLRTYALFRTEGGEDVAMGDEAIIVAGEALKQRREGKQFEVERHLQDELRQKIGQLEDGLTIIDAGIERSVSSGFIDILARDRNGAIVAIELKAGLAKRDAVGQIAGYMGDLCEEEPHSKIRGVLVAADFDQGCRSAVRVIPSISLRRYQFNFTFEEVQ